MRLGVTMLEVARARRKAIDAGVAGADQVRPADWSTQAR
jgi:hypothetical protein